MYRQHSQTFIPPDEGAFISRWPMVDALLARSVLLEQAARACFPAPGLVLAESSAKNEITAAACRLSIEHANVLRSAFEIGAPGSGSAVLRLQYEAFLRGAWLHFAASPAQIDKLATALSLEAEHVAKALPGYSAMLKELAKTSPEAIHAPLQELDQYSRHAMNSFVHSGLHALHRTRHGYPVELVLTVVRFSNALMHLAYRLLAALSGSSRRMDRVTHLWTEYSDCLPMKSETQ